MAGVMGVLGTLPFVAAFGKVLTFTGLQRDIGEKWATHEVIGQKPTLEWVGHQACRVQLAVRFDSTTGVPPILGLTMLKAMAEKHEPQILLIGPDYLGKFVIESITEERKFHTNLGVCIVAEAKITLLESGGETVQGLIDSALSYL